mmetsp:Transcript_50945/g.94353  ORF Transcript_50945/g.94353 Transcript_50945/m.94353 type:complete len:82 (-) Transcript_50945:143-388(-)
MRSKSNEDDTLDMVRGKVSVLLMRKPKACETANLAAAAMKPTKKRSTTIAFIVTPQKADAAIPTVPLLNPTAAMETPAADD